jgi:hypothetical protein
MIRPVVLVLAAIMAGPAIWQASVDGQLDINSALTRFLIAVPVAILMVGGMRLLTADYRRDAASELMPDEEELADAAAKRATEAAANASPGAEPIRRPREATAGV